MQNVMKLLLGRGLVLSSCAFQDTRQLAKVDSAEIQIEMNTLLSQIPEKVLHYVEGEYPGKTISKITEDLAIYVVYVSNHTILIFTREGELISD